MSGHSKWSKVKHQKGKTDQVKGQAFTKLANAITIAVRGGFGKREIEKAREANMPKANIDRAIERGQGKGEHQELEELTYEAIGPGRTAILMTVATDNKNRTLSDIKYILNEFGGTLTGPGSVSYLFKYCGSIKVKKGQLSDDQHTEIALNLSCEDLVINDDFVVFYTDHTNFNKIKEKIRSQGLEIIDAELIFRPTTQVNISDEVTVKKIERLLSELSKDEDIQKVFTNVK